MDPQIIAIISSAVGIMAVVWTALRFQREDSKSVVGTMRDLTAELRLELERTQKEREALRNHNVALETTVARLETECRHLRIEVTKLRESREQPL